MISAASHHFSLPAIAFKTTSWIFIIRSVSADGICCSVACTPPSFSHPLSQRTFHLLIEPDKSHANDRFELEFRSNCPQWCILIGNVSEYGNSHQFPRPRREAR